MRAALTHPASKLFKISLRLDVFVCHVLVVKKMKRKTNSVFGILVVVYGFVDSHKDMNVNKFRIPNTKHFIKGGSVKPSKG